MSDVGFNGPESPQANQSGENTPDESGEQSYEQLGDDGNPFGKNDEGLATEVPTADTMESGGEAPNAALPDPGQWDGNQEGEEGDLNFEQGQGGT